MRLGVLGPSEGDLVSLGRAAEFMLDGARVSRAIYLGDDGALDATVTAWAERLVGSDPTDDGAFKRAALLATHGTAEQLDRFIATEKARLRLRALESLPPGDGRTIEMLGLRVGIFVYDKGRLDEEDILSANLIVYGKSSTPLVKQIGSRWFVTPGSVTCPTGGVAVIEDNDDDVVAEFFDAQGKLTVTEKLDMKQKATTTVQGG